MTNRRILTVGVSTLKAVYQLKSVTEERGDMCDYMYMSGDICDCTHMPAHVCAHMAVIPSAVPVTYILL